MKTENLVGHLLEYGGFYGEVMGDIKVDGSYD